jgi:hypothetical protein
MSLPTAIAAMIGEFNELYPGQPADEKTMKQLWEHVQKDGGHKIYKHEQGPWIEFKVESCYRDNSDDEEEEPEYEGKVLHMWLLSALENDRRSRVECRCYAASSEGLLHAIVDGKRYLKRYLDEGPCEGCATPTRKKLKLEGSQYCGSCVMKKALGT